MYNQGYRQDSYSGSRREPYIIRQPSYERDDDRPVRQSRKSKKALKKLKKGKRDADKPEVEGGVEAAPDGGVSAIAVIGGSAAITTANSVVKLSLHQSIESLNEDFGDRNNSGCIEGIRSNFDTIFGDDPESRALGTNCLNQGSSAFSCMMTTFYQIAFRSFPSNTSDLYPTYNSCLQKGQQSFFPCLYYNIPSFREFQGYNLIAQHCSYLWNSSMWNLTAPTALRLTAGNVFSASVTTEDDEFGTVLNYIFLAVSLFCVLLGAIISVFTGYRVTAVIGSILVAVGFIVASFISDDEEIVVQLLVGVVGGIGSAFLRVSAIIAVLEYFKDLRMKAIVLSGLGAVLINFLMIGLTFVDSIDFDWKTVFKFQAIPAVVSLVAGLFMKPLKLKSGNGRDRGDTSCSTKCSDYVFSRDLFTDVILYLLMFVFLLDQIGRPIFSEGMQPYLKEKKFSETQVDIQPFIENGGSLLGLLTLLFWRRQNLADNLTVMAALDILVGILALHVPELSIYAWAVAYSAIFGFTDGVFASMIQDAIPEGFERRHIRMVAGMLGLVAGIGLVVSGFVADAIDKHSEGKHVAYYFSGGCLIAAGIFSIISRVVVIRQQIKAEERYRERDEIEFDNR